MTATLRRAGPAVAPGPDTLGLTAPLPAPTATAGAPAVRARGLALAWLGVLSIATASAWLGVVGALALSRASDLGEAMSMARGRMVGPALVVTVALVLVAEQRWPAVKRPLLARAHLVDLCYLALFGIVIVPALELVQTGFVIEAERHASFLVLSRLPAVPQVAVVVLTLVAMDGVNWAAHVANHRFETLWRLHALHHSQEDMSVLTTFRTHPLIHATYLPALLPALVLGASGGVPAAGIVAYGCLVTLPHANLNWRFGPLGRVFVSPAYHRLHHARQLGPKGTVNFSFVLVIWDMLAGRAEMPQPGSAAEPVATGLAERPVPVEQAGARQHLAGTVLAQLAQPFRRFSATDWRSRA